MLGPALQYRIFDRREASWRGQRLTLLPRHCRGTTELVRYPKDDIPDMHFGQLYILGVT